MTQLNWIHSSNLPIYSTFILLKKWELWCTLYVHYCGVARKGFCVRLSDVRFYLLVASPLATTGSMSERGYKNSFKPSKDITLKIKSLKQLQDVCGAYLKLENSIGPVIV